MPYTQRTYTINYYNYRQSSREGLEIGDLVYFATGKEESQTLSNSLIGVGNHLSLMRHLKYIRTPIPHDFKSLVHVEIVIGIDSQGYALLCGIPGLGEKIRVARFEEYCRTAHEKKQIRYWMVLRHRERSFASLLAKQMLSFLGRELKYSLLGCAMTLLPERLNPRLTVDSSSMMCQEITFNTLRLAYATRLEQQWESIMQGSISDWNAPGVPYLIYRKTGILPLLPPVCENFPACSAPGIAISKLLETGLWSKSELIPIKSDQSKRLARR